MLSLFPDAVNAGTNLLPMDGEVYYYGRIMDIAVADIYFRRLMQGTEWKNDEAIILGRHIVTRRQVAWYGDERYEYVYSRTRKIALPWIPVLLELKQLAEQRSGETYNSCLANHYPTGADGVAWHSDGEPDLKKDGAIASVSFGAERRFSFKHKETGETRSILLEHGSLLVMKGSTQTHWLHRLPPTRRIHAPRINLTFRTIEE